MRFLKRKFFIIIVFISFSSNSFAQSDCYWDFEGCATSAEEHIYGSHAIYGEVTSVALGRFIRDLRVCFASYDECTGAQ